MEYNKFAPLFGTWAEKFKPFIESKEFDNIYNVLKEKSKRGVQIAPLSSDTYRSFEYCDYNKVKAIIIAMDPYNSIKDGIIVSDGVPLSCSKTGVPQPSLEIFYQGMEKDLCEGMNLKMDKRPDLSYLLKEEHVLLLNAALTVEIGKPGSHQELWRPFMEFFINEIVNYYMRGLPIVFLGKAAQKYEKHLAPFTHWSKSVDHMASASYKGTEWNHQNMFSWCNEIIKQNNGESETIKWYREL